jgi:4-hydroxy 2-oxovalerate aldolase
MGRGPGNVDTIKLIKSLKQKSKGLDDIKKRFNNLKKNYRWGKNIYYSMASKKKIHPTYIQEILEYNNLSERSIFKFINYLGKFPTHSYSNLILEEAVSSLNRGSQNLTKLNKYNLKNKDILILGSSKNLIEKYFIEIENFILKKKPLVFSLNFNKENLDKYVNFYIIGHINRIFTNDKNIKNNLNKIISSMMIETNKVNLKKLIVYPAIIKDGKFKQNKNNCILPNMLSFSYSAAICNYLKATNIFLAGFDGYQGHKNLKKNIEMIETVKIIENSTKKKFISLTPTIYPIKTSSSNNYL